MADRYDGSIGPGASEPESEPPSAMTASWTSVDSTGNARRGPRARATDYGTMQGAAGRTPQQPPTPQSLPPPPPSPQTQRTPRPQASRTPSAAAPHRGQEFSVEDDADEVDSDLKLARARAKQEYYQQRERQLRRRESTLRRRPTAQPPTLQTVESEEREDAAQVSGHDAAAAPDVAASDPPRPDGIGDPSSEETLQGDEEEDENEDERAVPAPAPSTDAEPREEEEEEEEEDNEDVEDVEPSTPEDDDANLSDAESFTLKDRQQAINQTHPFGIRIWKPALYKKSRSVQRTAEGDIHSAPGGNVSRWLFVFNWLWTLIFGWWLALLASCGGIVNLLLAACFGIPSCHDYGRVLMNLAHYLFYPFGKYVKLEHDEAYLDEDEGEGRSISEYERWQTGDLEEGRLFFGPTDIGRSIVGRRRDEVEDLAPPPDETDSLLGRQGRPRSETERARARTKKRLFGRGKWNVGRVIFFLSFYFLLTPCLFLVSGICWFLVFSIPMGKVALLLFHHLRRHPLALSFHSESHYARVSSMPQGPSGSSILLCTYRAVGLKYWKYTIDGTNIFLINLLGLVVFTIVDYFVLFETLGIRTWVTSLGLIFVLALASIIPLAYFIGQAVASISAQSSMGVGATINAFFSTVVEVFLYCVALKEGKAQLVEGSIIGSIFAGILFLPGLSMCFGAIKRKTQRFNVRSAGVTSTMLLFAVIGAFGPTLFYQIYGSHELQCTDCQPRSSSGAHDQERDCRRCYLVQNPALHDRFFTEAVQPYIWFAAVCLFLSYVVGLLFTLRTHAAVIWNNEPDERKDAIREEALRRWEERHGSTVTGSGVREVPAVLRPGLAGGDAAGRTVTSARESVKDSQTYRRILNQSLKHAGINPHQTAAPNGDLQHAPEDGATVGTADGGQHVPHIVPPKPADADTGSVKSVKIHGLSAEDNRALAQQAAEMAATAATVATKDVTKAPRKTALMARTSSTAGGKGHHTSSGGKDSVHRTPGPGSIGDSSELRPDAGAGAGGHPAGGEKHEAEHASGGHDAPNWSRSKSAVILLTATVAYAVIAEILVDTVDAVLSNSDIDEKFLGITLFALVPNTTEFLNAISFAMNGNVALSMEIGSSYALQVMLLQIPCLVLFSAVYGRFIDAGDLTRHTFSLIFPQWDMVTVILGVFLMGWVVGEGKSNYFKGSTLIFTYLVVAVGFWFSGFGDLETMGVDRYDTLAIGASPQMEMLRTAGKGGNRAAYYS